MKLDFPAPTSPASKILMYLTFELLRLSSLSLFSKTSFLLLKKGHFYKAILKIHTFACTDRLSILFFKEELFFTYSQGVSLHGLSISVNRDGNNYDYIINAK